MTETIVLSVLTGLAGTCAGVLAQSGSAPTWLAPSAAAAAVVAGLAVIAWQFWRVKLARAKVAPATNARPSNRETEQFARDAAEVVDRLGSILDAKAARIERLLEDADRKIRELDGLGKGAPRREEFPSPARRTIRPQATTRLNEDSPIGGAQQQILDLAERGLKPVEIAMQLQQPVGQVELIIALNRGALRL